MNYVVSLKHWYKTHCSHWPFQAFEEHCEFFFFQYNIFIDYSEISHNESWYFSVLPGNHHHPKKREEKKENTQVHYILFTTHWSMVKLPVTSFLTTPPELLSEAVSCGTVAFWDGVAGDCHRSLLRLTNCKSAVINTNAKIASLPFTFNFCWNANSWCASQGYYSLKNNLVTQTNNCEQIFWLMLRWNTSWELFFTGRQHIFSVHLGRIWFVYEFVPTFFMFLKF